MKQSMQSMFEFMSRQENWTNAVLFIICYTLFVILVGVALAWIVSILIDRKVNRSGSFDDLSDMYYDGSFKRMKKVK